MLPLLDMEAYQAAAPPESSGSGRNSSTSSKQQRQVMRTVSISILVMSLPVLYVSFLHVPPAALFRDTTFWFLMSNSIIIVIAADSGMLFFRSPSTSSSSSCSFDGGSGGLPFVVVAEPPAVAVIKNVHAAPPPVAAELVVKNTGHALAVREQPPEPAPRDLEVVSENGGDDRGNHAHALVVREDINVDGDGDQAAAGSQLESRAIVPATPAADSRPRLTASRSLAREDRARRRRHHRPSRSHSHALVPVQDTSVAANEVEQAPLRRTVAAAEESEYARLSDEELNRRVEEFIARFNREMRLQQEKEQQRT